MRLDQRTRLYCQTDFFNSQSNDLAKALLSFSEYGKILKQDIEAINYFKSYGAILFDKDLSYKSLNHRVEWVDQHQDYILNFENNDIIDRTSSKACFVSFCFEYKRFIRFINNIEATSFKTNLPIQLDASCNGYQHISLLTKQKELFNTLNLSTSTKGDVPGDLYVRILVNIKESINNRLNNSEYANEEEKDSLTRLINVGLIRKIIKKIIMTKSYNAKSRSLAKYFKEFMVTHKKYG